MTLNEITGDVLDASVKIHKMFGPGLLESVYERLLDIELRKRGHIVRRQVPVSFVYEGVRFENAFRLDLLIDDSVIVELKSTASMQPVFPKQVRTYLVLTGREVGLLVNFGMGTLKEGFVRVVNSYRPNVSSSANKADHIISDYDLCVSASLRETSDTAPASDLCASPLIGIASRLAALGGYSSLRETSDTAPASDLCASASLRDQDLST